MRRKSKSPFSACKYPDYLYIEGPNGCFALMKRRRKIYIVIAWVLIFLQCVSYAGPLAKGERVFEEVTIPFLLGYHFFFLLAIILLIKANHLKQRIARREEMENLRAFLADKETKTGTGSP